MSEEIGEACSPSALDAPVAVTSGSPDAVLGIECNHHYGITTHDLPDDGDVVPYVYGLLRGWHPSLTDTDHTWEAVEGERWSRIAITKNEESPPFLLKPWWVKDGPGAPWFSLEYRIATAAAVRDEYDAACRKAVAKEEAAALHRDTIRGRKAAKNDRSLANEYRRQSRVIAGRWPSLGLIGLDHKHYAPTHQSTGAERRAEPIFAASHSLNPNGETK